MRIYFDGDRGVCTWYLPVVKSKVAEFVKRIEMRDDIKQSVMQLTFHQPDAKVVVGYHFGEVDVIIQALKPVPKKPEPKKVEQPLEAVLACGSEDLGYNVAVMSMNQGAIQYYKFLKMADIMAAFPVAKYEEADIFRYKYATASEVTSEAESIFEHFSDSTLPGINPIEVFAPHDDVTIPGPRCAPGIFSIDSRVEPFDSSGLPEGAPEIFCTSPTSVSETALADFQSPGLPVSYAMEYSPRVFIIDQKGDTVDFFDKRDIRLVVNGGTSISGLCNQAWVASGTEDLIGADSKNLYIVYHGIYTNIDNDRNHFFDLTPNTSLLQVYGAFSIQKQSCPAGIVKLLNHDTMLDRVWGLTHNFLNRDPNFLLFNRTEEFTRPMNNEFFTEVYQNSDLYVLGELDETIARSYYSYTYPNILFGQPLVAPMTNTIDAFMKAPVTGMFIETLGDSAHRPCPTCAKNVLHSITMNGARFDIYFSAFLEAEYQYNGSISKYEVTTVRPVYLGAAKKTDSSGESEPGILENMMTAISTFRAADIADEKVPENGPDICFGSTMFYFFDKSQANHYQEALDCFNEINKYRIEMGVPQLQWDITLTSAARIHLDDMVRNSFVGHEGSDGAQSWNRIAACGISGQTPQQSVYSEIIAVNAETAVDAVNVWKASTMGHHEALYTKRHKVAGFAVGRNLSNEKLWVVTFAGDYALDTIP